MCNSHFQVCLRLKIHTVTDQKYVFTMCNVSVRDAELVQFQHPCITCAMLASLPNMHLNEDLSSILSLSLSLKGIRSDIIEKPGKKSSWVNPFENCLFKSSFYIFHKREELIPPSLSSFENCLWSAFMQMHWLNCDTNSPFIVQWDHPCCNHHNLHHYHH